MRYPKKYTQKQWGKFEWHVQELLCKRYDIIITDWSTRKQKTFSWMKKNLTQKNLDKGIDMFNKGVQDFSKEMDKFTSALGEDDPKNKAFITGKSHSNSNNNIEALIGKKRKSKQTDMKIWNDKPKKKKSKKSKQTDMKIWNDKPKKKRSKKSKKKTISKDEANMKKIWG